MEPEGAAEPVSVSVSVSLLNLYFRSLCLSYTTVRVRPVTNDNFDNDYGMTVKILNNQKYFDPLEKPQDF